jgi:hypothetical protein
VDPEQRLDRDAFDLPDGGEDAQHDGRNDDDEGDDHADQCGGQVELVEQGDQGAVDEDERQHQGGAEQQVDPAQIGRPPDQHVRHLAILPNRGPAGIPLPGDRWGEQE